MRPIWSQLRWAAIVKGAWSLWVPRVVIIISGNDYRPNCELLESDLPIYTILCLYIAGLYGPLYCWFSQKPQKLGGWNSNPTSYHFRKVMRNMIVHAGQLPTSDGNCQPLDDQDNLQGLYTLGQHETHETDTVVPIEYLELWEVTCIGNLAGWVTEGSQQYTMTMSYITDWRLIRTKVDTLPS